MIIYRTINLINGKIYIGQDTKNDPIYLGSGKLIARAVKKYGKENFNKQIIDLAESLEELNKKEKYWIKFYNCKDPNGYNLTNGGNGTTGYIFTVHDKIKISKRSKETWKDPIKRKNRVDAQKEGWIKPGIKEKQSKLQKETWKDPIKRKNRVDAQKESWNDLERREEASRRVSGEDSPTKRLEVREKLSKVSKESWNNDLQRREDLSYRMSGENSPSKRPEIRDKIGRARKGKTYEEIYGVEKANEIKNKKRKFMKGNKYARIGGIK